MTARTAAQLAVNGGRPVRVRPLPPWPHYSPDEVLAAVRVLESGRVNYWTGEHCGRFEREFADYHGAGYGIALANGTLALELALRILGIGPGDEVIVTPRSYFASASCIVLAGATPIFADINPNSQNITASTIEPHISPRTKAIIAVHLAGWPCDMPAIMNLAAHHHLKVVEDCAQAHGARIDGVPVGSFGDVAAFSFCQDKIMSTAGEGGMLITSDPSLWESAWSFKDHGKSFKRVHASNHPPGFRWLHEGFGTNWRLTEIQASIGRLQLARLGEWVEKRRENAERLRRGIEHLEALRLPVPSDREYHAYYRFYTFLVEERLKTGWSRDRILEALTAEGIPGLSGSCPEIYREAAFEDRKYPTLPIARELGETSLMFLVHPTLQTEDLEDMARAIEKVVTVATA